MNFIGTLVTFQVTFTELFIAATIIASVAYKNGWKSAVLGCVLGLAAISTLSFLLGNLVSKVSTGWLNWISSLHSQVNRSINWSGTSIAAWGMFAEGVEIAIVWLAISLKQGMETATTGVLIGLGVIGLLALVLGKIRIFEKIPSKYLDFIAGTMVTIYGIYFLYEALA